MSPPGQFVKDIEGPGSRLRAVGLNSRRSLNPLTELASLIRLVRIYQRLRPELAQHFTVKPNVYGAIAARLCRCPCRVQWRAGAWATPLPQGGGSACRRLRLMLSALYKLTALQRQVCASEFPRPGPAFQCEKACFGTRQWSSQVALVLTFRSSIPARCQMKTNWP